MNQLFTTLSTTNKQHTNATFIPLPLGINITTLQRKNDQYTKKVLKKKKVVYFSGTYIDDRDAPIPGVPCLTGLLVIANSPR